ncbi:MAG: glycosyltransferase [Siphonobacter sp.]
MTLAEWILLGFALIWFGFAIYLCMGWEKWLQYRPGTTSSVKPLRISVIIPVRNEAENILALLEDLQQQTLPPDQFEVIIANDHSIDNTAELVENFQANYRLTVLNLSSESGSSPKKRAISQALQIAQHEWIVSTDGDCRVGPDWLSSIITYQQHSQAKLIAGLVTFHDEGTLASRIQIIEFASLVGTAAVSMFLKRPNMCNGANLSYAKSAFYEVGGFTGNEQLASGDDEFLMHKIAARFPDDVHFLNQQEAIVSTFAHHSWQSFYQQRRRWASKWKFYSDWKVSALAIFVFLVHLSVIIAVTGWITGVWPGWVMALVVLAKCTAEFLFLAKVARFLKQTAAIFCIPFTQLIYPFYVCFFGLLAQGKGYRWKGRKLQ